MMKVAVCGHMLFQEEDVLFFLRACAADADIDELHIREFSNPTDLIDACLNVPPDTTPLDLIVCGFDLPGVTGVQLAAELRDAGAIPHDVQVVLCAPDASCAAAARAAGVRALLAEPVDPATFRRVVGEVLREIADVHASSVVVRCRQRMRRIAFSHVRYIETAGHDQVIHFDDGRESCAVRGSSKALFSQLESDGRFFKVGSSFIANLDFARQLAMRAGVLAFDDGFQIPVPVRCRKELGEAMAAHSVAVL